MAISHKKVVTYHLGDLTSEDVSCLLRALDYACKYIEGLPSGAELNLKHWVNDFGASLAHEIRYSADNVSAPARWSQ